MADVDFYTLGDNSKTARLKAVCSLVERAFLAGERLLIWLEDPEAQASFDNLLWTFGDRAFVPHEPLGVDPRACEAPVQLHSGTTLPTTALQSGFTMLVALRNHASTEALQFPKVIEVLDADPAVREAGRARFRFYREHGAVPRHHELQES